MRRLDEYSTIRNYEKNMLVNDERYERRIRGLIGSFDNPQEIMTLLNVLTVALGPELFGESQVVIDSLPDICLFGSGLNLDLKC